MSPAKQGYSGVFTVDNEAAVACSAGFGIDYNPEGFSTGGTVVQPHATEQRQFGYRLDKGDYFIDVSARDDDSSGAPEPLCHWTFTLWPDPSEIGGETPIFPTDPGVDCVVHPSSGALTCASPPSKA